MARLAVGLVTSCLNICDATSVLEVVCALYISRRPSDAAALITNLTVSTLLHLLSLLFLLHFHPSYSQTCSCVLLPSALPLSSFSLRRLMRTLPLSSRIATSGRLVSLTLPQSLCGKPALGSLCAGRRLSNTILTLIQPDRCFQGHLQGPKAPNTEHGDHLPWPRRGQ